MSLWSGASGVGATSVHPDTLKRIFVLGTMNTGISACFDGLLPFRTGTKLCLPPHPDPRYGSWTSITKMEIPEPQDSVFRQILPRILGAYVIATEHILSKIILSMTGAFNQGTFRNRSISIKFVSRRDLMLSCSRRFLNASFACLLTLIGR